MGDFDFIMCDILFGFEMKHGKIVLTESLTVEIHIQRQLTYSDRAVAQKQSRSLVVALKYSVSPKTV